MAVEDTLLNDKRFLEDITHFYAFLNNFIYFFSLFSFFLLVFIRAIRGQNLFLPLRHLRF